VPYEKKFLLSLFLLACISNLSAIDFNFYLERLDLDFNGFVNSEITSVCYGTDILTITQTAYDVNGNSTEGTADVLVPHDWDKRSMFDIVPSDL
jgi:hypothetical protein